MRRDNPISNKVGCGFDFTFGHGALAGRSDALAWNCTDNQVGIESVRAEREQALNALID